jgi:hypothetical protein
VYYLGFYNLSKTHTDQKKQALVTIYDQGHLSGGGNRMNQKKKKNKKKERCTSRKDQ